MKEFDSFNTTQPRALASDVETGVCSLKTEPAYLVKLGIVLHSPDAFG